MAQLRQDYHKLVARNAEVVVVGPENAKAFAAYWQKESLPFVGLPDPSASILKRYGQEVNLFKLGRMPAQVVIDKSGVVRYVHYGKSMSDIPANEEILSLLAELDRLGQSTPTHHVEHNPDPARERRNRASADNARAERVLDCAAS